MSTIEPPHIDATSLPHIRTGNANHPIFVAKELKETLSRTSSARVTVSGSPNAPFDLPIHP